MSFFCLRRSSKGSWTPHVLKTDSQAPAGRVTLSQIERNNVEFTTQYRNALNSSKNENKQVAVIPLNDVSEHKIENSNSLPKDKPVNNVEDVNQKPVESNNVVSKTTKKKSQAPIPQTTANTTSATDGQSQLVSIEKSEKEVKNNKPNSEGIDSNNVVEISVSEATRESSKLQNTVVDANDIVHKDNALKSQVKFEEVSVPANESEEEVERANSGTTLSVHSISDQERVSIEVQVRRRSKIIPRPVTFNENSIGMLPVHPKDPSDEDLIRKALLANEFLSRLLSEGKRLEDVINAMYSRVVTPNEVIIKEGETGSHMFVSAEGKFEVTIAKQGVVTSFSDSRVFGELALLHSAKRLATVSATTHGKIWVLDQNVYNQLMVRTNIEEQNEILSFLHNVEKLNTVKPEVLRYVAKLLKIEYFKGGTDIVRQGEKGDKFYIIRAGSVTISKESEGVVNKFGKGKYFGELALLQEDTRQATVTADPPAVECFTLTRNQFMEHFGEVDDIASITISQRQPSRVSTIHKIPTEYADIDLMDLVIKATLGVGGFGRVELVQHKQRNSLTFALKYLKKYDMVEQEQQEHVKNEKNIQMSCKSIFIVRLYRTYKDDKYLYFLMESCLGGDLWNLLQKQKSRRFEEKNARFIAACVLEAIGYLHEREIVYRDLKPENLMIDSNGYIKLTDFGFAKKLSPGAKTYTFAGTPEYVAPEIVLNRGHDKSVDYWAFGIFIYELLSGRTPFRTNDPNHMKTYNKILGGIDKVQFPTYIPIKAKHIIDKLCRTAATERLGYQRGGVKDIKNHKWFLGFDWMKLNDRKLSSPFRPKLTSNIDTHYFDTFKKDYDIPPDETSGWDADF